MSKIRRGTEFSRRQILGGALLAGTLASLRQPVQASNSWGRVFIFNTASEPVGLSLNKSVLPTIVGTQRDDYYIPDVIVVDRTSMPRSLVMGEFADKNTLTVRYSDRAVNYEVDIDPKKFRFNIDLQLYVHRDGVFLLHNGESVDESVRRIS